MSCPLPSRCTPVGLGFKGLEMAMKWGRVDAIGDICEVPVRSLGIFEHTGCGEPHGEVGPGVLPTA